ncbi:MAG: hypothetical protein KQI35_18160 [Bacteroidetes bacterium]|nr:hypothetical protein [Bacteroidota bacterium]
MTALKSSYDISVNENVELYLFWVPNGNEVTVAIYIHDIVDGNYAELDSIFDSLPKGVDRNYVYSINGPNNDADTHTEYFEYVIEGPPQQIIADVTPTGGNSKANAVAL